MTPPRTTLGRRPSRRTGARPLLATLIAAALVLAACAPSGTPRPVASAAQASVPVAGTAQLVLDLTNEGDGDDRLVGVETDVALGVELHLTEVRDGRATMRMLDGIDLPAGERVRFRPGGLHLMLVVPDERVVAGGTFTITLRFERSAPQVVEVRVVDLLDLVGD